MNKYSLKKRNGVKQQSFKKRKRVKGGGVRMKYLQNQLSALSEKGQEVGNKAYQRVRDGKGYFIDRAYDFVNNIEANVKYNGNLKNKGEPLKAMYISDGDDEKEKIKKLYNDWYESKDEKRGEILTEETNKIQNMMENPQDTDTAKQIIKDGFPFLNKFSSDTTFNRLRGKENVKDATKQDIALSSANKAGRLSTDGEYWRKWGIDNGLSLPSDTNVLDNPQQIILSHFKRYYLYHMHCIANIDDGKRNTQLFKTAFTFFGSEFRKGEAALFGEKGKYEVAFTFNYEKLYKTFKSFYLATTAAELNKKYTSENPSKEFAGDPDYIQGLTASGNEEENKRYELFTYRRGNYNYANVGERKKLFDNLFNKYYKTPDLQEIANNKSKGRIDDFEAITKYAEQLCGHHWLKYILYDSAYRDIKHKLTVDVKISSQEELKFYKDFLEYITYKTTEHLLKHVINAYFIQSFTKKNFIKSNYRDSILGDTVVDVINNGFDNQIQYRKAAKINNELIMSDPFPLFVVEKEKDKALQLTINDKDSFKEVNEQLSTSKPNDAIVKFYSQQHYNTTTLKRVMKKENAKLDFGNILVMQKSESSETNTNVKCFFLQEFLYWLNYGFIRDVLPVSTKKNDDFVKDGTMDVNWFKECLGIDIESVLTKATNVETELNQTKKEQDTDLESVRNEKNEEDKNINGIKISGGDYADDKRVRELVTEYQNLRKEKMIIKDMNYPNEILQILPLMFSIVWNTNNISWVGWSPFSCRTKFHDWDSKNTEAVDRTEVHNFHKVARRIFAGDVVKHFTARTNSDDFLLLMQIFLKIDSLNSEIEELDQKQKKLENSKDPKKIEERGKIVSQLKEKNAEKGELKKEVNKIQPNQSTKGGSKLKGGQDTSKEDAIINQANQKNTQTQLNNITTSVSSKPGNPNSESAIKMADADAAAAPPDPSGQGYLGTGSIKERTKTLMGLPGFADKYGSKKETIEANPNETSMTNTPPKENTDLSESDKSQQDADLTESNKTQQDADAFYQKLAGVSNKDEIKEILSKDVFLETPSIFIKSGDKFYEITKD